uniref:Ubiquitin-related modifier 1 n=1 Tax=Oncorhynchus kisutch TaxID=8019 RepID=A0A8C7JZ48_ONCKI
MCCYLPSPPGGDQSGCPGSTPYSLVSPPSLYSPVSPLSLSLSFLQGGAVLLFDGVKEHLVTLQDQSEPWKMKQLLVWIRGNMLKEQPELFVQGDTVLMSDWFGSEFYRREDM